MEIFKSQQDFAEGCFQNFLFSSDSVHEKAQLRKSAKKFVFEKIAIDEQRKKIS
jgi:hypothetical protein